MIMKYGETKITLLVPLIWKILLTPINMGDVMTKLMKLLMACGTKNVHECQKIANGELFLVLGLICYCDKMGTVPEKFFGALFIYILYLQPLMQV